MKFIRFAGLFLVLLPLSCSKMDGVRGSGVISFEAYNGRDIVKAAITDVTSDNLTVFKVASFLNGTANKYFKAEETATKQSSGEFTTGTQYFWPVDYTLDFYAYKTSVSTSIANTGGTGTLSYTVPSDASDDLVAAYALNCAQTAVQPLSFSHALAKISALTLKARTGDASAGNHYRYVVEDLSVEAKGSGTFTFNSSNWALSGDVVNYKFTSMGSGASLNFPGNTSKTLEASSGVNDQLALLPQTVTIKLKYSIWYSPLESPGEDDWMKIMEPPSVAKQVAIVLEKGKAHHITLQLPNDGTPISFSLVVSDWLDESFSTEELEINPEVVDI